MNLQDIYTESFCKTAEAHGVDPEELVKTAQATQAVKTVLKGTSSAMSNLQRTLAGNFPVGRFPYIKEFARGSHSPLQATRQVARGIRTSPETLNPAWATKVIDDARIQDALHAFSTRASRVDHALKGSFTRTFGQGLPGPLTPAEKTTLQQIAAADKVRFQKLMNIARQRRLI